MVETVGKSIINLHFLACFVLFEQELISILPIIINIRLITIDIDEISYVIVFVSYVIKRETSIFGLIS